MIGYRDVEAAVLATSPERRGFDERWLWRSHPQTETELKTQPHLNATVLLFDLVEMLAVAAMQHLDFADAKGREQLREIVREADLFLACLKVGIREHDEDGTETT